MHLLLTNDDGIEAEGLRALADLVRRLPNVSRVTIVAPVDGRSACGHSVNTYSPIRLQSVAPDEYAVDGWPADCVRIAILHLGLKPDWILSGINHGGNLGIDIMMSGTCSAAREAAWLGYPSIAISQYRNPSTVVPWGVSASRAWQVVSEVITTMDYPSLHANKAISGLTETNAPGKTNASISASSPEASSISTIPAKVPLHGFWNVNLPAIDASLQLPKIIVCTPDPSPHHFHWDNTEEGLLYRSSYQARPRIPDHDIECCFRGAPTLSFCNTRSFL